MGLLWSCLFALIEPHATEKLGISETNCYDAIYHESLLIGP